MPHLQFIFGNDKSTALLTVNGFLGVVLALLDVVGQQVKLDHCRAAVAGVVTFDVQPRQQVTQYPRHLFQLV